MLASSHELNKYHINDEETVLTEREAIAVITISGLTEIFIKIGDTVVTITCGFSNRKFGKCNCL